MRTEVGKATPTVIIDGNCGPCAWMGDFAAYRYKGPLDVIPGQISEADKFGFSKEQRAQAVCFMDSKGSRFTGAAAVNEVLSGMGSPWSIFARIYKAPGMAALEERAYKIAAKNRPFMAKVLNSFGQKLTPYCERPEFSDHRNRL